MRCRKDRVKEKTIGNVISTLLMEFVLITVCINVGVL